jgi:hypothetical protein
MNKRKVGYSALMVFHLLLTVLYVMILQRWFNVFLMFLLVCEFCIALYYGFYVFELKPNSFESAKKGTWFLGWSCFLVGFTIMGNLVFFFVGLVITITAFWLMLQEDIDLLEGNTT